MKKLKHFNPIVSEVIEQFETLELMTRMFTRPLNEEAATRGLLISGDAGMGKTRWVQLALESVDPSNIYYIKGSSITAAALFIKLYLTREQGKVLVLDDVDIIHKGPQELNTILDLLKGATEMTNKKRVISWERAKTNSHMSSLGVESEFDYQGSIIWITNDSFAEMEKRCKGHWPAIVSRFTPLSIRLDQHQRLQYTLYLLTECDMLGKNCNTKEGGYSKKIIRDTMDFIATHWGSLRELSPRTAAKIADAMEMYPKLWRMILENSMLNK